MSLSFDRMWHPRTRRRNRAITRMLALLMFACSAIATAVTASIFSNGRQQKCLSTPTSTYSFSWLSFSSSRRAGECRRNNKKSYPRTLSTVTIHKIKKDLTSNRSHHFQLGVNNIGLTNYSPEHAMLEYPSFQRLTSPHTSILG
jgi:hypothetical protein